jgi:hypothetical protein
MGSAWVVCAGAEDAHARIMVQDAGRSQDGRAQAAQAAALPHGMKNPDQQR